MRKKIEGEKGVKSEKESEKESEEEEIFVKKKENREEEEEDWKFRVWDNGGKRLVWEERRYK